MWHIVVESFLSSAISRSLSPWSCATLEAPVCLVTIELAWPKVGDRHPEEEPPLLRFRTARMAGPKSYRRRGKVSAH